MKTHAIYLTSAQLNQLSAYVQSVENEGWYFSPKSLFEKNHKAIKEKIHEAWKAIPAHSAFPDRV
jgi:hypothetical protein